MARPHKPWYCKASGGFVIEVHRKRHLLARGPNDGQTHDAAKLAFHRLMAECLANPPVDGGKPTVASILEAFLDYDTSRTSADFFETRKRYLQRFADHYGGRLVRECVPYHLTTWLDQCYGHRSADTRHNVVSCVKRPFNWAVKQGLIERNPFQGVTEPNGGPRRETTTTEYKALLEATADTRHGEVLQFLALTGCRCGELRQLRWSQIDWGRNIAVLQEHKTKRKIKKPRIIQLPPAIIELLQQIRDRHEGADHVFLTPRGAPWAKDSISQHVRRLRKELGLPSDLVISGLRHHYVTTALGTGVEIHDAALLAGHSSTRMTEHYSHLSSKDARLAEVAARVAKSVSGA